MLMDRDMRLMSYGPLWFERGLLYQTADLFWLLAHPRCYGDKRWLQIRYIVPSLDSVMLTVELTILYVIKTCRLPNLSALTAPSPSTAWPVHLHIVISRNWWTWKASHHTPADAKYAELLDSVETLTSINLFASSAEVGRTLFDFFRN